MDKKAELIFSEPSSEKIKEDVTFAMVKPDALKSGEWKDIMKKIENTGLTVRAAQVTILDRQKIEDLYRDRILPDWAEELFEYLVSGPSITLVISGENANQKMTDLRNKIRDEYDVHFLRNMIHAANNTEEAKRQIKLFFNDDVLLN